MNIASNALIESGAVTSVYDLLRQRCGLSQADAASFHDTRIDTIKSWCSDRRTAPAGVLDELRDLYADISEAGEELADVVKLLPCCGRARHCIASGPGPNYAARARSNSNRCFAKEATKFQSHSLSLQGL